MLKTALCVYEDNLLALKYVYELRHYWILSLSFTQSFLYYYIKSQTIKFWLVFDTLLINYLWPVGLEDRGRLWQPSECILPMAEEARPPRSSWPQIPGCVHTYHKVRVYIVCFMQLNTKLNVQFYFIYKSPFVLFNISTLTAIV